MHCRLLVVRALSTSLELPHLQATLSSVEHQAGGTGTEGRPFARLPLLPPLPPEAVGAPLLAPVGALLRRLTGASLLAGGAPVQRSDTAFAGNWRENTQSSLSPGSLFSAPRRRPADGCLSFACFCVESHSSLASLFKCVTDSPMCK